jgi:uncharacterized phage protein gp47/JayE
VTLSCVNDPVLADVFTITINGTNYSYTVPGAKTKQEVLHELYLLIQAGEPSLNVIEGVEELRIYTDDIILYFMISCNALLQFDIVGTIGIFMCTVDGANYVPAGSITTIITPVSGLDSVNNIVAGTVGRDVMGDDEFRVYRRNNLQTNAKATDNAIQSNLSELLGVSYVKVISNRLMTTDAEGRPPKSFETIIQGGDDDEIAAAIWLNQASGIESFGTITKIVQDSNGDNQTIKFSRPVPKFVWIQLEVNSSGLEEGNAPTLVKEAIYDWSQNKENVYIGSPIIFEKHYTPIYSVKGVTETNFLRIGVSDSALIPPVSYVTSNIYLEEGELAEYAIDRMEVNFV